MAIQNQIIVLHGQNADYLFNPTSAKSQIRKISKFSRVFKGESSEGTPVVIKMLPSELTSNMVEVERFKSEINWYGLHPNLLAPFEYIFQDNHHYLIIEYVKNIDLGDYIRHRIVFKRRRIRLAIECGLQLLDALEALHSRGFIHTDIKPANVLLLTNRAGYPDYKNPQFQLIDFGMVRKYNETPIPNSERTRRPFVLVYSPPEQVLGFQELVGFHSDLYNIALLLYEMITKEPAYESRISVKLILLQTSFPLPVKKVIPEELMEILLKAASKYHFKKPPNHFKREEVIHRLKEGIEQRYQTTSEFKQALELFKFNYFKA
ncbi:MAG: serine/threonine-protein kinase [Salinivirgaceae bacterium]|jgi:serine/threonine-protein kinase